MNAYQEELNKLLLDPRFRNWALNSNKEDFEEWEGYLRGDDQLRKRAQKAKEIILQIELSESKYTEEDISSFEGLKKKLKEREQDRPAKEDKSGKFSVKLSFSSIVKVAAAISFMIVFSGLLYFNNQKRKNQLIAERVPEVVEKHTQNGQQLLITLPDGSKVKLNSNSSITYPVNFFNNRRIEFEGEAFFKIVRNEKSPFIVKTEHFQTEVLGTSFNICAYEKGKAKVSVIEGKVKISTVKDKHLHYRILEKEEAAEIDDQVIKETSFNRDEVLWKDGILVFSNEDIHSIAGKIERWFNVTVVVKNGNTIGRRFSGKYSNESLKEILIGMGYALNFSFELKGNEVIIIGNKK